MARYAVNRKFQILCKKVNKHPIHDPQVQQHRVRFGATVLWLFQACLGIDSCNAAWVEDSMRNFKITFRKTGALPALANSTAEFAITAKGLIIST